MSIPKDSLDQLLSGYLDGALSDDERIRVKRLLESDAAAREALAELRQVRTALKTLAHADSGVRLDAGFADRVLDAAVAQARAEGLDDSHPLIRLSEQPSVPDGTVHASSNRTTRRVLVAIAAVAAAIGFAIFIVQPNSNNDDSSLQAQHQVNQQQGSESSSVAQLQPEPQGSSQGQPVQGQLAQGQLAQGQPAQDESTRVESDQPSTIAEMDRQHDGSRDHGLASSDGRDADLPQSANIAQAPDTVSPPKQMSASPNGLVSNTMAPLTSTGLLIVLDVRQSDLGKQQQVVQEALKAASIGSADELPITDQVAQFVDDSVDAQAHDDQATILLLNVSGKSFDKFYSRLWNDQDGVESIRMSLVADAPLIQAVESLQPADPTTVQHDAVAYKLISEGKTIERFAAELDRLPYAPMGDRSGSPITLPGATGPDVKAQVLVVVR